MKNSFAISLLFSASTILATSAISNYAIAVPHTDKAHQAEVQSVTKVFSIDKMTCKMCHITVRKAIENVDGVVKATVDYDTKTATVLFDPKKASIEAIALASTNSGYPATIKPATVKKAQ